MTAVNGDTARKRIPDAVSTQQGRLFSVIHISTHVEVERVVACVTKKKTNTYLYAMYNIRNSLWYRIINFFPHLASVVSFKFLYLKHSNFRASYKQINKKC